MYDDTGVSSKEEGLQLYGTCPPLPLRPRRKTENAEEENEVYEDFDKESEYDSISVPREMEEPKALPEPPATAQWTLNLAQWKGCWRNYLVLLLAFVGLPIGIILLAQHAVIFSELKKLNTSCPQETRALSIVPPTTGKLKIAFLKDLTALEERIDRRNEATDRKVEQQISKLEGEMSALENMREICRRTDPSFWHKFLGSCYYYSEDVKEWEEARKFCITINSHLVIINSKSEQDFVVKKIKFTSVWIGVSDAMNEGMWQWVDGTALTGSFWRNGEPNNRGVENCAVLYKEGNWNDIACNLKVHFVCEKPTGCNC